MHRSLAFSCACLSLRRSIACSTSLSASSSFSSCALSSISLSISSAVYTRAPPCCFTGSFIEEPGFTAPDTALIMRCVCSRCRRSSSRGVCDYRRRTHDPTTTSGCLSSSIQARNRRQAINFPVRPVRADHPRRTELLASNHWLLVAVRNFATRISFAKCAIVSTPNGQSPPLTSCTCLLPYCYRKSSPWSSAQLHSTVCSVLCLFGIDRSTNLLGLNPTSKVVWNQQDSCSFSLGDAGGRCRAHTVYAWCELHVSWCYYPIGRPSSLQKVSR